MSEGSRAGVVSLGLYGAAFVLILAAGAFLGAAMLDELQETTFLWVSAVLSCVAVLLAVAALLLPGRSAG